MIAGISRKVVAITFVAAVILARLLPWLPWDGEHLELRGLCGSIFC